MDINIKNLTKEQREDLLKQLQEYKENKKWRPKINCRYYRVERNDIKIYNYQNGDYEENLFLDNLCFPYSDEGKKQAEHRLTIEQGRYEYLKLIAKINEEDGCPEDFPDWEDKNQIKHQVNYSYNYNKCISNEWYSRNNSDSNEYAYREIKESELTENIKYFLKYR